jgi:hypothetical protein
MKVYRGTEVLFHAVLTSELEWKLMVSFTPRSLYPGKIPGPHRIILHTRIAVLQNITG